MMFGKKRSKKTVRKEREKLQARQKIWENPSVVEKLFRDEDWLDFEVRHVEEPVPSKQMLDRIEEEIVQEEKRKSQQVRRSIRLHRMLEIGIAAALLLFISFAYWQADTQLVEIQDRQSVDAVVDHWVTRRNDTELVDTLVLPDQSKVHLFAQSEIRYLAGFSTNARDVQLTGKAFFSVTKDSGRPFSVFASGTKTTALGTSFTVDARLDAARTVVELHSGKVLVASTAKEPTFENTFLDKPGANLLLDNQGHMLQVAKPKQDIAKVVEKPLVQPASTSMLEFENMPLAEVFKQLEEVYSCAIVLEDSAIAQIHYTASINQQDEELSDVIAVISLINNLRYELDSSGTYHIYQQELAIKENK